MTTTETKPNRTIQTLDVVKEIQINAPIEVVFETVLEPAGPMANMSLKLEPWPGGRVNHYLFDLNRDWIALTQPETVETQIEVLQSGPFIDRVLRRAGASSVGGKVLRIKASRNGAASVPRGNMATAANPSVSTGSRANQAVIPRELTRAGSAHRTRGASCQRS